MKTIIAGTRTIQDYELLKRVIAGSMFRITEVVCGLSEGVDKLGERWAIENKVPIKYFSADWSRFGKSAGPKRNKQMAEYADALLYIWDGKSTGTANMINYARLNGLAIYGQEMEAW